MSEPLPIAPGVVIPGDAFEVRAVRSGGPGGQNVNKVASKVELRVNLARVTGLDGGARARLQALAARSLDADGQLLVVSQRTRDQPKNLADARDKVRDLVLRALVVPRRRRPTRPTRGSVERRLDEKRKNSGRKRDRGRDPD